MSGEDFRARLRRLRREETPAAGSGETDRAEGTVPPTGPSVADRLRAHRERRGGSAEEGRSSHPGPADTVPVTSGDPRDLVIEREGTSEELAARVERLDGEHGHGSFTLAEVAHADPADFALLTGDAALAGLDLTSVIYLDTETTGLSGGAGTYVFQIGLGRFTEGGRVFELWQGFLRGPERERALLEECARRIERASGVVSFFGKSFDRHRLEDKMRLVGVVPPFEGKPHLDLYHPCRRLYAATLPDGRLQTMERALCGVEREGDLPGSYAPEAWFDYLAGREHRLEAVLEHNRDDVLSLVTLAAHLGRTRVEKRRCGTPLEGHEAFRAYALARVLRAAGESKEALRWLDVALERIEGRPRGWLLERGALLGSCAEKDEALRVYQELVGGEEDRCTTPALLELAKLLEHHRRDLEGALGCCELAAVALPRNHVGGEYARLKRDLERRGQRLRARVGRG